jgi:uncharacterized phage protein (TIGR02218 family)
MSIAEHLATGGTTVCRCWAVRRRDGKVLGFTDHDRNLAFDGVDFRADTGMTARAFEQSTGMSVDNSEALGALSDDAIRAQDVEAGRFDAATITMWIVNWQNPDERAVRFAGTIGEIVSSGESFRAELRGLTETLNQPQGLLYQRTCSAVLGDHRCQVDLAGPAYRCDIAVDQVSGGKTFTFASFPPFQGGWFAGGVLTVLNGEGNGLAAHIKVDRTTGAGRRIVLWEALRAAVVTGTGLRLTAGCDKRAETCRAKFGNFLNFRGFPSIPGEDWLISYPTDRVPNDGGKL